MAGTIFGLGMSQRVDANGKPAAGWLLYLYQANTSTPVTAYQDTALSVVHPWPIEADANGMMPPFWLPDGNYRARGTSLDGATSFFDLPSVLAIGASAGQAPSGGVDPNAIFQTGDLIWMDVQGTRAGWVRDNARTIGSASSGATERANADCQALFEFLWNNFDNARCPVVGGRGASALADWTANKQLTTPDKRARGPMGLDDMGNTAAGRFGGVPILLGSQTAPGSVLGDNRHTLDVNEIPPHTHTASVTDPGHAHLGGAAAPQQIATIQGGSTPITGVVLQDGTASATTGITVSNANTGNGGFHNNVHSVVMGTYFRKL